MCPVRQLWDDGIDVGLGTDVSGGYSASILVAAREAAMVSRTLAGLTTTTTTENDALGNDDKKELLRRGDDGGLKHSTTAKDRKKLSVEECLYLATVGGAKCLNLEGKVGGFEVGMLWDAQLVELGEADDDDDDGPVKLWGGETWGERVAKWLFCGDDRNTKMVFVGGRLVHVRR